MSENDEQAALKDLNELHDNIAKALRLAFGARLKTVSEYDPVDGETGAIQTPAVLLELVEIRPAGKVTGGRTPVELAWSAHCVLSEATANVQREVRNFAAKVLTVVDGNRWELAGAVTRAEELSAFPGMFKPGEHGFDSWIVNWKQVAHLGDSWELPVDGPALEVYVGESPNVGRAHVGEYERIA